MFERRLVHAQGVELMLREVADRESLSAAKVSAQLREDPHNRLDEGGLSGSVYAQNTDSVARAD